MSVYSSQVLKSTILDSANHRSKFRTEFRLQDDAVYMSNMKLCNLGIISAAGNQVYNQLVGTYGTVERISLYDGLTLLDELKNANIYLAWKQTRKSQQGAEEMRNLSKNKLGHRFDLNKRQDVLGANYDATNDANTTDLGVLELNKCMPLLGALTMLPTALFPNLRLQIEYDTDVRKFSEVDNVDFSNNDPVLKVDKVEDPDAMKKLMSGLKSVSYMALEHDTYTLSALPRQNNTVNVGTETLQSQKVNGFNGKNIERLLIIKQMLNPTGVDTYSNNAVVGYGNMGSYGFKGEGLQVKLNGANILPSTRKGANSLTALLNDSWGSQCSYFNSNDPHDSVITRNGAGVQANTTLVGTGREKTAQLSYLGLYVGSQEPVSDLQIELTRNAMNHNTGDFYQNKTIQVHLYAEVPKSLVIKGGEYNLVYN
jgi:hypothetical protein